MKNILLHPFLKRELVKEFDCSRQTVDMSLKFVFNSAKSLKIRQRAKELLKEEIKKIAQGEKKLVLTKENKNGNK